MIGSTVSHYRIIEELGGGLGVVYKAEDTRDALMHDSGLRVVARISAFAFPIPPIEALAYE